MERRRDPVLRRARVRAGIRGVWRYSDGTEKGDVEGDFVYENWSTERASILRSDNFPRPLTNETSFRAEITHNYRDTFGVRVGGAYNFWLGPRTRLIGRLGYYYDSAATRSAATRLDFNTLDKFGFTGGIGVRWRGLTVNVAYAYVYSPPRNVTDSEIYALSSVNGSQRDPSEPLVAIGNGRYVQSTQIFSVGVTVNPGEFRLKKLLPN